MSSSLATRLTLKFNFAQKIRACGWSESYDLGYADIPTAYSSVANINAFINDRLDLLGFGPYLASAVLTGFLQPPTPGAPPPRRNTVALPVPSIPGPGDAYNRYFGNLAPGIGSADFSPTVFYVKLQTNLSGSPVYSRNLWLAGLPDGADETDSNTIVLPAANTAMNVFLQDLQNNATRNAGKNNVSIRSIDRSNANPIKPATAWNTAANTYTVPNHGFAQGQPVLAEGCKAFPGGTAPRGRYLISAVVDINTIALQGSSPPTNPRKLGGFRAAIVVFNTIGAATGNGFTKRDKGRLFFQSVGRRKSVQIGRA